MWNEAIEMKKALIVATVGGFIASFELSDVELLQKMGYEVHAASNFCMLPSTREKEKLREARLLCHQIDFSRDPFQVENIRAYHQLKTLFAKHHFDIVHCHTPVGGTLARLCAAAYRKRGTKVIYTAHGFHFYKGAPIQSWLIYYPIEKILSCVTDLLITINKEDYVLAKKKMYAEKIKYLPGIGVDVKQFCSGTVDISKKRKEFGLSDSDIILLSVGELSKRKNHEVVIRAIQKLNNPQIKYLLCGCGALRERLEKISEELGVKEQILFLGYRNDIADICQSADLFVLPSRQEGLPMALMEAIACNLPAACSDIRGNRDLLTEYLFRPDDVDHVKEVLEKAIDDILHNRYKVDYHLILKKINLIHIKKRMKKLYEELLWQ